MRCDEEGADAARAMAGAATAVEKKALVLFALFSALRERRCTPREVSIVDDVDGGVGGAVVRASQPTRRGIKLAVQTPTARCRPAPTLPAPDLSINFPLRLAHLARSPLLDARPRVTIALSHTYTQWQRRCTLRTHEAFADQGLRDYDLAMGTTCHPSIAQLEERGTVMDTKP